MIRIHCVLCLAFLLALAGIAPAAKPLYGTVSVLSSAPLTTARVQLFDAGYGGSVAGYAVLNPHVHVGCRLAVDYWFYHEKAMYGFGTRRDDSFVESLAASVRFVRTTFDRKQIWPTRAFLEIGAGLFHFDRTFGMTPSHTHEQSWRGGFNAGAGVQLGGRNSLRFELVPMLHLVQSPAYKPYHYFSAHAGVLFGKPL